MCLRLDGQSRVYNLRVCMCLRLLTFRSPEGTFHLSATQEVRLGT